MNVRLIAGKFGGRTIAAPPGNKTHPMGERIRNALFNSLGDRIDQAVVLDAFAGSGAVGLEAISRGARDVTFIEKDRVAARVLQENIDKLAAGDQSRLIRTSVSNWLDTTTDAKRFDLIFADPPYHDLQLSTVKRLFGLLKPGALMVLSHTGRGEVPVQDGIVVVDNRSYGNAYLTFFRREE